MTRTFGKTIPREMQSPHGKGVLLLYMLTVSTLENYPRFAGELSALQTTPLGCDSAMARLVTVECRRWSPTVLKREPLPSMARGMGRRECPPT